MKNSHSLDFYHAAIKSVDADACDIRQPELAGKNAQVFYADVGPDTYVYRFTDEYFIRRNHKISYLLALCDVPAPRIQTHCYMRTRFESYAYKPDKTMYENNMTAQLSDQETFTIYQELMRIEYAISKISLAEVGNIPYIFYSQIYSEKHNMDYTQPIATMINAAIYALSRTGKMRLFHNDPTPGNILLSQDKHISYLLDLDGVCASNTYFALMKMLQYCPNYMWRDLLRYYEKLSHQFVPQNLIINTMKLLHKIKPDWAIFVLNKKSSR